MSAESYIKDFLEEKIDFNEDTEVLTEAHGKAKDINLGPFFKIFKSVASIRNSRGVLAIAKKTRQIKSISQKTIQDIDTAIFKGETKNKLPTSNKPIDNEKSADTYLRTYYNYMSTKFDNLEWRELAKAYINSKTVVRNTLVSAGILGAGAAAGAGISQTIKRSKMSGSVGSVAGGAVVSILALIIVVTSVSNAVIKSRDFSDEGKPIIDYRKAWRNVIDGFKKVFSGKDVDPEAGALARVVAYIVPLTVFIFSFSFHHLYDDIFKKGGKWIFQAFVYTAGVVANTFKSIWQIIESVKKNITGFVAGEKLPEGVKTVNPGFKDNMERISQRIKAPKFVGFSETTGLLVGKSVAYVIIPVLCLAIVLYLFSEMLDRFQFKKIEKMQKEEEEQDIDDIL